MTNFKIARILACAAMTVFTFALPAQANFIQNGSFESTSNGTDKQFDSTITDPQTTHATHWTTKASEDFSYNFIFSPGVADKAGGNGPIHGNLKLWGPGNGSNNNFADESPDGGNFLAADGAYKTASIEQTVANLTIGKVYEVGFWWAAAQQYGFDGDTTDKWQVSFGGTTKETPVAKITSHGFSGWMHQTLEFTAASANQVLSFLAIGTPNGVPPFALLDGVTVNEIPEPGSLALMFVALLAFVATRKGQKV